MTSEECKKLKPGDIVEVTGPRSINIGKMGIVRFIQMSETGACEVYMEPYNCEFEIHKTMHVLYGDIIIYGFIRQQLSIVKK